MKEGWTYKKLGEVFVSVNNGANIKQVKGASGIPITRIETLSNDRFNRNRMGYANIYDTTPYESYVLNSGDILMSHINSMKFLGRAVVYTREGDEKIIHGMNLLRLVPISGVLSSFMSYQFQTKFFRDQILHISHQSVNQASFNITNLKTLSVIVPPHSEQQSIVDYLDSTFAKIDALKANAQKQLNEAKALFQASIKEMLEPKEEWEYRIFESCLVKVPKQVQIKSKDYKKEGKFPIVSQEAELISGYWDDDTIVYKHKEPVVIFGDHTKNIKYVDFNFVVGADGIHILSTKKDINPKYFYYVLKSIKLRELGYARHYKLLKEEYIPVPSLSEQQSIVATLDSLKSKVERLQENYDKISQECDALKQAILRETFE